MSDSEDGWDDEVTVIFRDIAQHAEKLNFENAEDVERFISKYGGRFTEKNSSDETILHYMAARAMSENSPQHRFLKFLLQKHGGSALLVVESGDGTPLHVALQRMANRKSNPVFVETALEFADSSSLQKALGLAGNVFGNNCLHHAIQYEFRSIMRLISKCPRELFCQPNANGNTPLHLAMALVIKEGMVLQKASVQQGAERKDETLLRWKNAGDDSRPRNEDARVKGSDTPKQKGDSVGKNFALPRINRALISNEAIANSSKSIQTGRERLVCVTNTFYLPDVVERLMSDPLIARNMLIHKNNPSQGGTVPARGPYQHRISQVLKSPSKHLRHVMREQSELSEETVIQHDLIASYIKSYCLRNLEREDVIRILYEKGEGTVVLL